MKRRVLLPLLIASLAAAQTTPRDPGPAAAWWHDVTVLAADSMRGRNTGSDEYLKAAKYVADQFAAAGLEPGGTQGFFQTVKLMGAKFAGDKSSVLLVSRTGSADTLKAPSDITITVNATMTTRLDAPLVFVGYGLHQPGVYDDVGATDVRGKVAVFLNRMPPTVTGTMFAHLRSQRWNLLHRAGAVGAIAINDPPTSDSARKAVKEALPARLQTVLAENPDSGGMQILLQAASAEQLFAGTGHTYAELLDKAKNNRLLSSFALPKRLRATVTIERSPVQAPNVIGVLRGNDPALRDEYVVVTAHLDHIGVTKPVNGDSVNNGAMDNASGIATLLETARALHRTGAKLKRSVLFLAVTGEEEGLLGSMYYALHPTIPTKQIAADLNTDMWMPIFPLKGVFGYGAEESDLGVTLGEVLKAHNLAMLTDPQTEEGRFVRSDQYSFIRRGIPALALKNGFADKSPEMKTMTDWVRANYHKPSDDLDQPIDFSAVTAFNAMYLDLVKAVADRPTKPKWNATSFFGKGR